MKRLPGSGSTHLHRAALPHRQIPSPSRVRQPATQGQLALAPDTSYFFTFVTTAEKSTRRQPYLTPIVPKVEENSISEEPRGPEDSANSLFKVLSLPEALVQDKLTRLW